MTVLVAVAVDLSAAVAKQAPGPDELATMHRAVLIFDRGRREWRRNSTLANLLCRLYDPQRGLIRWDGVDIRDVDPPALRERMAAMPAD